MLNSPFNPDKVLFVHRPMMFNFVKLTKYSKSICSIKLVLLLITFQFYKQMFISHEDTALSESLTFASEQADDSVSDCN